MWRSRALRLRVLRTMHRQMSQVCDVSVCDRSPAASSARADARAAWTRRGVDHLIIIIRNKQTNKQTN